MLPGNLAQPCSPVPEVTSDSWDDLARSYIALGCNTENAPRATAPWSRRGRWIGRDFHEHIRITVIFAMYRWEVIGGPRWANDWACKQN